MVSHEDPVQIGCSRCACTIQKGNLSEETLPAYAVRVERNPLNMAKPDRASITVRGRSIVDASVIKVLAPGPTHQTDILHVGDYSLDVPALLSRLSEALTLMNKIPRVAFYIIEPLEQLLLLCSAIAGVFVPRVVSVRYTNYGSGLCENESGSV